MSELRYLFFLGCTIPYRVLSYEISARKVFEKLGIDLVEMPDFNCCGLPVDPANHEVMLALAARNLWEFVLLYVHRSLPTRRGSC